ncbi:MAG: DUF1622 domain-containing protein [Candidatus Omnitrophica bacterium]|nr:DUF1622 domain-containing protein [Candidatus Omnitrophota bacterium]MCM8831300.1 DUF1622 domain-containing protein [Candidatus Omnitrophota bacterium]
MNLFYKAVDLSSLITNIIGAFITLWGVLVAVFEFLKGRIKKEDCLKYNEFVRIKLGSYLVLALEFFIASDIIKTIITPTWQGLGILGAIVVIRTILSYFLTKDLKRM